MQEIKALFFDIDGTLLPHGDDAIQESILDAIQQAQNKGYKVAIASSRPMAIIKDVENIFTINWDGIVAGSGTNIYETNHHLFQETTLSKTTLKTIFDRAKEHDIPVYTVGDEAFFTKINDLSEWMIQTFNIKTRVTHPYQDEKVQLITLMHQDIQKIKDLYKDLDDIRFVVGGKYNIDIFPKECNKNAGIQVLMKKWGFEPQEYMAFGDTAGDHEMLKEATVGLAMDIADETTKKLADDICKSIPDSLKKYQII